MSDHGNCPACKVDLNGGLIWEAFSAQYHDDTRADEVAATYGATRTSGRWGRQIAIYDRDRDRTVAYRCPDCAHEWKRT